MRARGGSGRRSRLDGGPRPFCHQTPEKDANSGPFVLTHLAEIYTIVGEPDLAIQTLRPLLAIPSWISGPELESDPTWARLRRHPRFAELAPRS
jgi:hypothetical protein